MLFFYILFELRLIPILLIILSQGAQPERLSAGAYLLFYTAAISIPYLVVIISLGMPLLNIGIDSFMQRSLLRSIFLLRPFLVKMPIFGVHFWLPKAHVEARTRGSMILAGLLLKLGSYGAARVVILICVLNPATWLSGLWVVLSLLAGTLTFIQSDLKKLVAYRSVTHITILIAGVITGRKLLIAIVLLVSLAHA